MVFWVGILVGAFFVWVAVGRGFYDTWTMLFNVVISVYTAVYLTPVIVDIIPAAGETVYGNALTLAAVAAAVFVILYVISLTFLTGQFKVAFPKIFDNLGAGILGFLGGLLIWSFAVLLISATPIGKNDFARSIGLGSEVGQTSNPYLCWWCDLINTAAASDDTRSAQKAVTWLLDQAQDKTLEKTDPNESPAAAPLNQSQ